MISNLIALPYKVVRTPLALVDGTLSHRLAETSAPRTTLDLLIGSTDKLAGALLRDEELARRGADRMERSGTLRQAAKLEHQADVKLKQAEDVAAAAGAEAERKRAAAEDRAAESMELADVVEASEKRDAKARARKEKAAKKRAADQEAGRRTATIEQRKQRVEAATEAKNKAAQRQAKHMFDRAREAEQDAAQSRADAERLDELAESKKRQRKES